MSIKPINSINPQTNFQAARLPGLKVKPRKTEHNVEQEQIRNYASAIVFALAFCAAALTKYFIEICNARPKMQASTEIPAEYQKQQSDNSSYQLK